jgi:hypothetical protein
MLPTHNSTPKKLIFLLVELYILSAWKVLKIIILKQQNVLTIQIVKIKDNSITVKTIKMHN